MEKVPDIIFVFTGESFGIVRNNSGEIVLLGNSSGTRINSAIIGSSRLKGFNLENSSKLNELFTNILSNIFKHFPISIYIYRYIV